MRRWLPFALMLAASVLGAATAVEEDVAGQAPPVILAVHVLNVGEDYFEVEWETDVPTKGSIEWGTTKDYGSDKSLEGSFDTYHRTNVTGLDRTTRYHFRIHVENLAGDTGRSGDQTVTTGPQDETEGGTPGWVWGLSAVIIIVLLFYMLMIRPGRQ